MLLRVILLIVSAISVVSLQTSSAESHGSPPLCAPSMTWGTSEPSPVYSNLVSWTASGSHILFNAVGALYIVDSQGIDLSRIADGLNRAPYRRELSGNSRITFDILPDESKIVYSSCRYRPQNELSTQNIHGTRETRLTRGRDNSVLPAWSPDGRRIAYIAEDWNTQRAQLRTLHVDGESPNTIISSNGELRPYFSPPAWSPSGEWIAFLANHRDSVHEGLERAAIYKVSPLGLNATLIAEADSGPSWAPDGERIVFTREVDRGVDLYTIAADGTGASLLTTLRVIHGSAAPAWSPTGRDILVRCIGVCVVDAEDGSLLGQSPIELHGGSIAAWSPDGSRIAVLVGRQFPYPNGTIVLYTMARDGTDVRVLVRGGASLVAENSGWHDTLAGLSACRGGHVVEEPHSNPGLVRDCESLMRLKNTLAGEHEWDEHEPYPAPSIPSRGHGRVVLNWGLATPIDRWTGVLIEDICSQSIGTLGGPCATTDSDFPELRQSAFGFEPPSPVRRVLRVVGLDFGAGPPDSHYEGSFLRGSLPAELAELDMLRTLNLSGSPSRPPGYYHYPSYLSYSGLSGGIPAELGELRHLELLKLGYSQLSGEIPPELGRLGNLRVLELSHSNLDGPIPPELGALTKLLHINLSRNQLSGDLPTEFGNLSELQTLSIADNSITGIPPELGAIRSLERLEVSSNPLECFPVELLHRDGLSRDVRRDDQGPCLAGSYSFLVSEIAEIGHTVGEMPSPYATKTEYSIVGGNEDGSFAIDANTGIITVVSNLDASAVPSYVLSVQADDDRERAITATVEISVISRTEPCSRGITVPYPEENPGLVSDCAFLLAGMDSIDGSDRELGWKASIPITEWRGVTLGGDPTRVQSLDLTGTGLGRIEGDYLPRGLTGQMPPEFGGLTDLVELDIYGQALTGEIPSELGDLRNLQRLQLYGNRFTGCIPAALRDVKSNDLKWLNLEFCMN